MTEYITLALAGAAAVLALVCVLTRPRQGATLRDLQNLSQELQEEMRALRTEVGGTIHGTLQSTAELQANAQRQVAEAQNTRLRELSEQLAVRQTALQKAVTDQLQFIEQRMKTGALESEQKLENIRTTMETRIAAMQADNGKRLDEMRHTVDEKLQKTLDEKLQQSFSRVSEQLESVYKGLGEMQTLATGVGDLKKVLSNVKTRGILGEIQLGAILEQILAPEQYAENVATVKGSSERVEYAVRLPATAPPVCICPSTQNFPSTHTTACWTPTTPPMRRRWRRPPRFWSSASASLRRTSIPSTSMCLKRRISALCSCPSRAFTPRWCGGAWWSACRRSSKSSSQGRRPWPRC